jgi:membrane protease YdiL (CAAX protease family)
VSKPLVIAIPGIIFLFFIGFGEELLSRGLIFGVLSRFGIYRAVFGSSLLFGLMHLNLYIGSDWDPWQAYAHVLSATSFGVLACGLMIITRSIWPCIILHLFINWSLVFGKFSDSNITLPDWRFGSVWEGITYPLPGAFSAIGGGVLFLVLNQMGLPKSLYRLAIKWKLINTKIEVPT